MLKSSDKYFKKSANQNETSNVILPSINAINPLLLQLQRSNQLLIIKYKLMRNNRFFALMLFLSATIAFTSCSKDEDDPAEEKDTTKPLIDLTSPADDTEFLPGDVIPFSAVLSDDKALGSYKIDIHPGEGHDHKSADDNGAWSYQKSWSLPEGSTNETVSHSEIVVPEEVDGLPTMPGDYHFLVYCTDKEGNEEFVAHDIIIVEPADETAPEISFSFTPEENQVYIRADTIKIEGSVTDNKHLSELLVAIMRTTSSEDMVNTTDAFVIMLNANEQLVDQNSFDFNASIPVGAPQDNNVPPRNVTWSRGNFYLIVKAIDESGNVAFSQHFPIVIQ